MLYKIHPQYAKYLLHYSWLIVMCNIMDHTLVTEDVQNTASRDSVIGPHFVMQFLVSSFATHLAEEERAGCFTLFF